eukprot:998751-Pleurochrysis_carterae.AAC.1
MVVEHAERAYVAVDSCDRHLTDVLAHHTLCRSKCPYSVAMHVSTVLCTVYKSVLDHLRWAAHRSVTATDSTDEWPRFDTLAAKLLRASRDRLRMRLLRDTGAGFNCMHRSLKGFQSRATALRNFSRLGSSSLDRSTVHRFTINNGANWLDHSHFLKRSSTFEFGARTHFQLYLSSVTVPILMDPVPKA